MIENFTGTENSRENLQTPKQIADARILSLVQQWRERRKGTLKFYQVGRKILYDQKHIAEFLQSCEQNGE